MPCVVFVRVPVMRVLFHAFRIDLGRGMRHRDDGCPGLSWLDWVNCTKAIKWGRNGSREAGKAYSQSVTNLPEPAVLALLEGLQEVFAHNGCLSDTPILSAMAFLYDSLQLALVPVVHVRVCTRGGAFSFASITTICVNVYLGVTATHCEVMAELALIAFGTKAALEVLAHNRFRIRTFSMRMP